jgi:hypothetical protein
MNITIAFGWWLIPAVITRYAFWRSFRYWIKRGPIRGDYDFGVDVLLAHGAALIVTLLVWLIYAVLRLCLG